MSPNRQLAAIMFTDIVGYTSLMGHNENKALQSVYRNRKIHQATIRKFKGRWLKEMGDGTLASFSSASDAVYCASEILHKCNDVNIILRIGIHIGDIVQENGDVLGDGVNLASRLESSAKANSICISEPVYRNVKNQAGVKCDFIEEKIFKNVDDPVKIYSVTVDLSLLPEESKRSRWISARVIRIIALPSLLILIIYGLISYIKNENETHSRTFGASIAVMPFTDMSPDHDQAYLGDGIAEEIINQLTHVQGLKVIGRTSSFSFRNKETDLKTIGQMLGVETILEGSVQKSGNKLRITAQLISTEDAFHIWSERFDREMDMEGIFEIQDELAQLVVSKIYAGTISNPDKLTSAYRHIDPKAYEFFLKGKHIHQTKFEVSFEIEDFKTAENMFLQSIAIDSNFALPHAGLADIYHSYQTTFSSDDDPEKQKYLNLQKVHINKAYSLDPYSDYVNLIKGWVNNALENYDSAYYYIKKAITLNPKSARNYWGLAYFLFQFGLNDEADILFEKAKNIDPLDIALYDVKAQIVWARGNDEKALDILNDALLINPHYQNALFFKTVILLANGRINEAQEPYNTLVKMISLENLGFLHGAMYAAQGDSLRAFNTFDGTPLFYKLLGNKVGFLNSMPHYLNEPDNRIKSFYITMKYCKYFDWVRNEPEFKILLKKEKKEYDNYKNKYGDLDFINVSSN